MSKEIDLESGDFSPGPNCDYGKEMCKRVCLAAGSIYSELGHAREGRPNDLQSRLASHHCKHPQAETARSEAEEHLAK